MRSFYRINAPAKVNLFLNLISPREDGYHEVRSVMQALFLSDQLEIEVLGHGSNIELSCTDPILSTPDNLVVKAYDLFYRQFGLTPYSLRVKLHKVIPFQAGLGGGSSDAAAMLKVLNQIHQLEISLTNLQQVAGQLGSDVPFFLTDGTAIASGYGEKISQLTPLPSYEIVLLKPKSLGISTPDAYKLVRQANCYDEKDFSEWSHFTHQPYYDPKLLGSMLFNDFEAVLFPQYPQLHQAKQILLDIGLPGVLLSGSGPTIFGLLDNPDEQWLKVQSCFPNQDWQCYRTRFLSPISKDKEIDVVYH